MRRRIKRKRHKIKLPKETTCAYNIWLVTVVAKWQWQNHMDITLNIICVYPKLTSSMRRKTSKFWSEIRFWLKFHGCNIL